MTTEKTEEHFANAVSRGAAWLDKTRPGWSDTIDLWTLEMDSCTDCILGQIFKNYFRAPAPLRISPAMDARDRHVVFSQWAIDHGFTVLYARADAFDKLKGAWVDELTRRGANGLR